ncbi:hypothetical protein [Gordonia sp. OPL2]|uniref:hypothetical protein n=1 Tax=Gordonia sp. OPL2 TaxID=2486274 RepID=UPI001655E134|nr:hypothetical protein [Gordonia sp. OPL2]ROZ89110.1 hypothetical protein EEB19_19580 [Gordonia sp. OPL2]
MTADVADCRGEQGALENVSCAVALTHEWLRHTGRSSVVRETVRVSNPAAGVSWNPRNSDVCVYAELGTLLALGLHHCNAVTFYNPTSDAELIRTRSRAVTTFAHESSHGVQESAGLKPVSATIAALAVGRTAEIRTMELASDCWSGAAWTWLVGQGHLTAADRAEAVAFMYALPADRPTHGSGQERGRAFERGIVDGVAACNHILGRPVYT